MHMVLSFKGPRRTLAAVADSQEEAGIRGNTCLSLLTWASLVGVLPLACTTDS
jgi:hypothetical protein